MFRPIIAITYSSAELDVFNHWRLMFEGVVAAGGVPLAIDCRSEVVEIEKLVRRADGLIIGGGGDVSPELYGGDPKDPTLRGVNQHRDANESSAWRAAESHGIPVLAICRGAQLLTALLGGELYIDLARDHGNKVAHLHTEDALVESIHSVTLDPSSELVHWVGGVTKIEVNSQHHQGIRVLPVPFTAIGYSDDGLVEAYEWAEKDLVAVQWHPEVLWSTSSQQLAILEGFISKAKENRAPQR